MAITPKDINDALRNVIFPGSDENIVQMDMVQEIRITGDEVAFTLVFQKNNDKSIPVVKAMCVQALKSHVSKDIKVAGNISVRSVHNMERPVLPGVQNIIAIASGKGGVGKSTVSSNLAVALAKTGASVGLIDADIFGPSLPKMFGVEDEKPLGTKVGKRDMIVPVEKYGVKLMSIGFFVEPEKAIVWRGSMASNALNQLIIDAVWGPLDYLLIDLPPGTSDIHLTLMQTVPVTGAVVVTTPQDVALADVLKGVNMFRGKKIDVPVIGLVENMAWFTPEELPENKYYIFGKGGGVKMAKELDIPFLGQIPLVQSIREGGDEGIPAVAGNNPVTAAAFEQLAKEVITSIEKRNADLPATTVISMGKK